MELLGKAAGTGCFRYDVSSALVGWPPYITQASSLEKCARTQQTGPCMNANSGGTTAVTSFAFVAVVNYSVHVKTKKICRAFCIRGLFERYCQQLRPVQVTC
jgi:hypothetical protein